MDPSPATPPPPATPKTLAERLDHLFTTVHPKGRGPYSYEEVASGIKRQGGATISASYIWQLRSGGKDNPTKRHLEALGSFFGVPVSYFFDDEESRRIQAEIDALAAMRDAGVRSVALRASGLSDKSLQIISDVIDRARELEGLRSSEPEDGDSPTKGSGASHE
ncbi:helix-turn-helix domain-containing protein [Streptomyces olivaceus]|uniref:helix-turn-helix domain-containing protein n=1 Tax=Streptomyces olivaceus TaxID=47716 RepID=UPI001CC97DB6|nr:helix-turn-helix domain-containing protein [Streptomyces olivaceus]MBZ6205834.1 helix-turn-helix domain-containing protein [Streptomyces olivaceus]